MHLAGTGNLDPIALDLDLAARLEHDEARAHLESQLLRGPERHPGCRQRECAPGLQTGHRSHAQVESTVHRDRLVQIHLEAVGSADRRLSVRAYRHRPTTTHAELLIAAHGHGPAALDRDRLCGIRSGRAPRRSLHLCHGPSFPVAALPALARADPARRPPGASTAPPFLDGATRDTLVFRRNGAMDLLELRVVERILA